MRYSTAITAMLIGLTIACGGGGDSATPEPAADDASRTSAADLPDPCTLVTDEEVSDLLWRGMEAGQRTSLQARNATHVFTKRVENVDVPAGRTCHFEYRRTARDTVWGEGDFRLRTLARQTFDIFAGSSSSREPIPGVGDEAFYMSNAAYGRRGDVGIEVVDFSSKEYEIELLRNAVARLP